LEEHRPAGRAHRRKFLPCFKANPRSGDEKAAGARFIRLEDLSSPMIGLKAVLKSQLIVDQQGSILKFKSFHKKPEPIIPASYIFSTLRNSIAPLPLSGDV